MDGRAHKRVAVDREVQCKICGVPGWVRIYDLSASGAMIEVAGYRLAVGDPIELDLYEMMTMSGQVVWKIGNNAGVRFDGLVGDWILERLGFTVSSLNFDEFQPRDRFGQLLSNEPQNVAGSATQQPGKPADGPGDWQATARVQEDRRQRDDPAPRRNAERLEIDVPAVLGLTPESGIEGRLTNLSTGGCSFRDPSRTLRKGETVWLKFESVEPWQGIIRWVVSEHVGVEFDRPFHPSVVDHLIAKSRKGPE